MNEVEVVVGRIGKPHGIRGEVTVDVRTDEPARRYAAGAVLTGRGPDGATTTLTVQGTRDHQGVLLVSFEEIGDRNAAEAARGTVLATTIAPDETPSGPDEYYEHQLVGLRVHDPEGTLLGEVTGLVPGAAQDLLAVRSADGRDVLVPFVAALVPEVDLAAGLVVVADRPGLVAPFPDES